MFFIPRPTMILVGFLGGIALPSLAIVPSTASRGEHQSPSSIVPTAAAAAETSPVSLAVDRSIRPIRRAHAQSSGTATPVAAGVDRDFRQWLTEFRARAQRAGITTSTFDRAFAGVRPDADIIRRDRNQSEFTRALWDYLDSAVSAARVRDGQTALATHRDILAAIERRYGVEAEIVAAIWGLESAYGRVRGDTNVIAAMATLAYDGRRRDFFEEQLIAALRILQSGEVGPNGMRGSWAGAMGHTQFMPTSYLDYAVDITGDGRRDIWSDNPADALASTANYLARFGWTSGQPWGMEVRLPQGFDYSQTGERIKRNVAHWHRAGVRLPNGGRVPDHGRASILLPAGANGVAFIIFDNFHVIERYNTADAYVIAVGHLADRITGDAAFQATWPRGDRALTFAEREELQNRLTRAGFPTEGIDGIIGPNTIEAVRRYQASQGLVPDGYASLRILQRLR